MATTVETAPVGSWLQIATGVALFRIREAGEGTLYVNNATDLDTARRFSGADEIDKEFTAADDVPTYARASGDGWKIAVTPQGGGRLADV